MQTAPAQLRLNNVNDALFTGIAHKSHAAMQYRDESWNWTTLDSAEVYRRVRTFASVLRSLGVKSVDRVAILAENRWEWAVSDFAVLGLGAVDVPLYPTLMPEQIQFMLNDSGAKVAIVSTREQARKVLDVRAHTAVEHVIVMDGVNVDGAERFGELMGNALPMQEAEFESIARAVPPAALATIIYTSGTTGEPKGVMLTHHNIASNLNEATTLFGWDPGFSSISFLPLSHITARALDYAVFSRGATIAYCPDFADVVRTFREIKPKIVVSVPRVYEKVRQEVERKAGASPVKKKILEWAVSVGQQHRNEILSGQKPSGAKYKLADKLIFSKVYEVFGGRATHFISGGAPLGMETAGWFADVGIVIYEGYGLTETSPVISLNNPSAHRIGSVGKVLANVEVCFAPDQELLVRGPNIFAGYWNNPRATTEAFSNGPEGAAPKTVIPAQTDASALGNTVIPAPKTVIPTGADGEGGRAVEEPALSPDDEEDEEDEAAETLAAQIFTRSPVGFHIPHTTPATTDERGLAPCNTEGMWFHTGDIAHLDSDGFLYITDRKKELLKTSGGKFIAPAPIENTVKANVLIGHAALVGDRRKFASIIISPNFAALEGWAKQKGIAADIKTPEGRKALVENAKVIAEYQQQIDKANANLAQYETIKKFYLAPDEWTLETGELTPSMKLKRRVISHKYHEQIEQLYRDAETERAPQT